MPMMNDASVGGSRTPKARREDDGDDATTSSLLSAKLL
jgi:hypothetical protein